MGKKLLYSASYQGFSLRVYHSILIYIRYVSISLPRKMFEIYRYGYHSIYNKKVKETGKERKRKYGTKTIMHSGSRPNHEGTRLMFASGTVSPMMCPPDGQEKDDKNGQVGDKARGGQRQGPKSKRRQRQGGRFSLKLFSPGDFK